MDKVSLIEVEQVDGSMETFVIIDRGNGEFTSMLKADYDAQQAEQSTPFVTPAE